MPHNRFFLPQNFSAHETVELTDDEHLHLSRVMRLEKADAVEIVNGAGDLGFGRISLVSKRETLIELTHVASDHSLSGFTLCQALPKSPNLHLIVEKCTELGVDMILIFPSERAEKYEISGNQMERLKKIAISALKQSGRLLLPKIEWAPKLPPLTGSVYFGDLETKEKGKVEGPTYFINGPEKGFSEKELKEMKAQGYIGISLSRHILRTETAAIAAAAQLTR